MKSRHASSAIDLVNPQRRKESARWSHQSALDTAIALDDTALWDDYTAACLARQVANQHVQETAQRVLNSLRKPTRAEVQFPPPPTPAEIQALARLYVTERLRSRRKIDPAFRLLSGVSKDNMESASPVPPGIVRVLYSKGWISSVGSGYYIITPQGANELENAAWPDI